MNNLPIWRKQKPLLSKKTVLLCSVVFLLFCLATTGMAQDQPAPAPEPQQAFWLWALLGRFHPAIVHFPIGFLYIALLLDLLGRRKKSTAFQGSIYIVMVVAAVSAVLSVVLGLILINTEEYGSAVLSLHQWTGIATMVLAILATYLYRKQQWKPALYTLCFATLGVTIAGHFGAELTHGEDFLSSVFPKPADEEEAEDQPVFTLASFKGGALNDRQVQDLNFQVRSILAHNCYSCHGPAKVKGDLRLDSKDAIFKGGEDGLVVEPGHPENSELIRRVRLPRNHKDAMPSKGKALTNDEIEILEFWIKQGAPWPAGPERSLYRVAKLEPRMPEIPAATKDLVNPVDRFVNAYFQKKKIDWNDPVDDRTYIRRVYLDVVGLVPPADSIDAYVQDQHPDKQALLVNRLLNRNQDYAQHWLSFWNDALRNDYTGTGYITGGRMDITQWLYNSLDSNKPYNQFVKELINPDKASAGFIRGIQWRGVVNSSQSTEMQAAQNVSQVFLGLNLKCASCHDSFISDWKLSDSYAFANVFCDSTLEIHRCDKPTGQIAGRRILYPVLGAIDSAAVKAVRLQQLADNLVQPKDGRLYRTLVNRIWAQLFGRGIVEPVDVMDNKPWSQDLLDWLASDFVAQGTDMKKLLATILTSKTYQLPSVGLKEPDELTSPKFVFSGMVRKRLTAEQFADAVSETLEPVYPDSMVVYDLLPKALKGKLAFPRAALMRNDPFLTALGRPNRETVTTSRSSQANLIQALELTNGSLFNETIKKAADHWLKKYPDPTTLVKQVYRSALGRYPKPEEETVAVQSIRQGKINEGVQDFLWAIALHPEFQLIY
jgi:uncharacterized membrane protein/mono/diheme cytochrome c family protein